MRGFPPFYKNNGKIQELLVYLINRKETQTVILSNYLPAGVSNDRAKEMVRQFVS